VNSSSLPISVIVVARNAEATIADCLRSLQRNCPAEIIVVDGRSTDRTVEIAHEFTTKIFSDDGKGLNYARQLGAEKAHQEYISYIDSDVILADGALATMLAEFQDSDYVSISACEAANMERASYWEWAQSEHYQLHRLQDHISMLASLFRRDTVLRYGFYLSMRGLDNRMDDIDLEIRLRRDGFRFGRSSALFYHHYRSDFAAFAKYRFFLGRVTACYIRKYGPWHIGFWPPLTRLYWLGSFLMKGRLRLIPYIVVDGVVETAGLTTGFCEVAMHRRERM
jgi:glycosyltransferase involved in cell wall biosynthesis